MAEKPTVPERPGYSNSDLDKLDPDQLHKFWQAEIEQAKKYFVDWWDVCDKLMERYRDERGRNESSSRRTSEGGRVQTKRFNILWSNVSTLFPALYSGIPDPVVSRRYKDEDPLARLSVEILERCLYYTVDPPEMEGSFDSAARLGVQNHLLGGRGTPWITHDREVEEIETTELVGEADPETGEIEYEEQTTVEERLVSEKVSFANVQYRDYMHSISPTWQEVLKRGWVSRRVYMTKTEVKDKFGERAGKEAQVTASDTTDALGRYPRDSGERKNKQPKYVEVWEIWNRPNRKVYFYTPGWGEMLVEDGGDDPAHDDPLRLRDFYPTPCPLYATMTEDRLIPVPDYHEYADQATNLDEITNRKWLLTTALRAAGLYAAKEGEKLQQLFDGTNRNTMIPVQNWSDIAMDNGAVNFNNLVVWVPLDTIMQALSGLQQMEADNKQQVYEITGIADIVRGQSKASETLGAQRLKGQWASVRISDRQAEVGAFLRGCMRIAAEIIAEHFDERTIAEMSNFANSKWVETYGEVFSAAVQLLRDDKLRSFQIDVETADTVFADEMEERRQNVEMIGRVTEFLQAMIETISQAPETAGVMSEMLKIGMSSFSGSKARELDVKVDEMLALVEKKIEDAQNQPDQPTPEMIEAQNKQTDIRRQAAADLAKAEDAKTGRQLEATGQILDYQDAQARNALEKRKQDLDFQGKRAAELTRILSSGGRG